MVNNNNNNVSQLFSGPPIAWSTTVLHEAHDFSKGVPLGNLAFKENVPNYFFLGLLLHMQNMYKLKFLPI